MMMMILLTALMDPMRDLVLTVSVVVLVFFIIVIWFLIIMKLLLMIQIVSSIVIPLLLMIVMVLLMIILLTVSMEHMKVVCSSPESIVCHMFDILLTHISMSSLTFFLPVFLVRWGRARFFGRGTVRRGTVRRKKKW